MYAPAGRFRLGQFVLIVVSAVTILVSVPVRADDGKPDLSIGAERYPDADAIVLRLEQHWRLNPDGSVSRREHRWVKLMNSRPIGDEADPRIDFEEGVDRVTIHAARTHLPNGDVLDVPEYSFNRAAPRDVGGWPEYANWQQWVVSFSGIGDEAVLEMDYEVETKPGQVPWIDADLRLNGEYPTVERVVSVTVPRSTKLAHVLDRVPDRSVRFAETSDQGSDTYRWEFRDLADAPDEPQAPPWFERTGRLRFTTSGNGDEWVRSTLRRMTSAVEKGQTQSALAKSATADETDPLERVRKISEKLKDSFNYVTSPKTLRSLQCRRSEDTLISNYGNPLEAAAVLAGVLRAAGFDADPELAVSASAWDKQVPTWSAFAGAVVRVELPDGPVHVYPREGLFENPGTWGRYLLFGAAADGTVRETYIAARGEDQPSELTATGRITVAADGQAQGELRFSLSGVFYDPLQLRTADAQEKFAKRLVGRIISGLEVASVSIAALSAAEMRATVNVSSKEPLTKFRDGRMLTFHDGPAFLTEVPMPLSRSDRRTDVKLTGAFREQIDLTVQIPEKWTASILPARFHRLEGDWGSVEQSVEVRERNVRFRRSVSANRDRLEPAAFNHLREAINDLRAAASRVLAFEPAPTDVAKGM